MSEARGNVVGSVEQWLKIGTAIVGLMSGGLALYIAFQTQLISSSVDAVKADVSRALDDKLKQQAVDLQELKLNSQTWEDSTRLVAEWQILTAGEFARALEQTDFLWADEDLKKELLSHVENWKRRKGLMGRDPSGLLLRQIICLRLVNVSSTPAQSVHLELSRLDFPSKAEGQVGGTYAELVANQQGATTEQLGTLMNSDVKSWGLANEALVPVAQVVGVDRYVGRVLLPQKVTWQDPRQRKQGNMAIDRRDPRLQNRLVSAALGHSKGT